MAGSCTAGSPKTCAAADQCHLAGVCAPSTGLCSSPVVSDGTTCNDGNACTLVDACVAGTCTGASPRTCSASDQCHVAGVCQPATGVCSNPAAADGTSCDDLNMCTVGDACVAGACTPVETLPPSHCDTFSCESCTADNCIPYTDGCDLIADPTDRQLCENAYRCFTNPANNCTSQGDPLSCWCGSNGATCLTDNAPPTQANGPCLQQIFAAAKTTDAPTIRQRFVDPDYPLGRASNLVLCRGSFCAAECSLP